MPSTREKTMRRLRHAAAAAAAATLIAQPGLAATDVRGDGAAERRSGAFAGVRLRVPIGARNQERPSARMQLTTVHDYRTAAGATVRSFRPDGLEFGAGQRGRLAVRIAGQDIGRLEERLPASGSTRTILIVGAVVVAAIVLIPVLTAYYIDTD
jgi:hypothetical protein